MNKLTCCLISVCLFHAPGVVLGDPGKHSPKGLNPQAMEELETAGVNKYMGDFVPAISQDAGDGWIKHTYDPAGGNGPICIAGTPFSTFTLERNPSKLLIMLQGGGACWQDFYFCNILAGDQAPPPPPVGIWGDSFDTGAEVIPNPIGDWSVVYMPYCDGSVFSGDNDVFDPHFPFGPVRFHRGLRNVTAGIDLAKSMFPQAKEIMLAGSSAGGVGAAGFAPFLARFAFGNNKKLKVFNDAGPVAVNLFDVSNILARTADWLFGQFYPASCTDCDVLGQGTEIIKWRLDNDSTVREAFYSTDGDETNRFFLSVPTQAQYRDLIVTEHGLIHDAYPDRYKRFIRSGDNSHTALQTPLFYVGEANDVPLHEWVNAFVHDKGKKKKSKKKGKKKGKKKSNKPRWEDIVEDFEPLP